MTTDISAAVVRARGAPFTIEPLTLSGPAADEVLVRIAAVGVCRTDLHMRDGEYSTPRPPFVAGHEGSGVVQAVGAAVTTVQRGDRVLLSFPSCGLCPLCLGGSPAYCRHGFDMSFGGQRLDGTTALTDADGRPVNGHVFQQSAFATHAVVHVRSVVRLAGDDDLDLTTLAPLGCGFATGAGAVLNTIRPRPGASIVVIGTGSVGLAAIMSAKVCHAGRIIAVDRNTGRLDVARELGATDLIAPMALESISDLVPLGVDAVIETTAVPENLTRAVGLLAPGGVLVLLGGGPLGTSASIDLTTLLNGRTVRGVIQGDAVPQDFLPRLIQLHRAGEFPFDRLITKYPFLDIERAIDDMDGGTTIKPVLVMPTG